VQRMGKYHLVVSHINSFTTLWLGEAIMSYWLVGHMLDL
jgi:hypothetical protein